jgi:hypothetical protein
MRRFNYPKGMIRTVITISLPMEMKKRFENLPIPVWMYIKQLEEAFEDFKRHMKTIKEHYDAGRTYYNLKEYEDVWRKRFIKYGIE